MTVLDRLKEAIAALKKKTKKLTNEAISRKLGYKSRTYLSDILGGSKPPTIFFLDALMVEYSIDKNWILKGEGKMFMENSIRSEDPGNFYPERRGAKLKKTDGSGWTGVPIFEVPLTSEIVEQAANRVRISRFSDCEFGIQASGDSMSPKIRNGDYVLCKEVDVDEIIMGDAYLVLTYKGTEVIKYIYPHEIKSDCILLVSDNQSLPPTALAKSAIRKLYKVKGVIKSY